MLRYAINLLSRWNHPLLMGLLAGSGILVFTAAVIEQFTQPRIASGFFMVYAVMFAFLGLFGYTVLFVTKIIATVRRRHDLA